VIVAIEAVPDGVTDPLGVAVTVPEESSVLDGVLRDLVLELDFVVVWLAVIDDSFVTVLLLVDETSDEASSVGLAVSVGIHVRHTQPPIERVGFRSLHVAVGGLPVLPA
jgi:hypothetical protein